ncbi:MAG: PAS domain S-box protein [Thermoanaerobaculales bacterium]
MTVASGRSLREVAKIDILADRHNLLLVGMVAVFAACVIFGAARLASTLSFGSRTPWWGNIAGAVLIVALYLWYRRRPAERSAWAAHGTALIATLALLIPAAYGMSSTLWWLGLVGFAMVLLGRRREAMTWGVAVPLVTGAAVLAEPLIRLASAPGETSLEYGMARVAFVITLVGMAAAFRRAAERRATELHDSKERYREVFDHAPEAIAHYDREMRVTDCNELFAGILGGDRERLVGLDLRSLEDQRLRPALEAALTGGHGEYEGAFHPGASSADVFVSLRTAPLHGKDGAVIGAIGILQDVTERKRMEAELQRSHTALEERVRERTEELGRLNLTLRESEERLELAIDNTGLGLWDYHLDTGKLTLSERWAAMLGYSLAELEGESEPWRSRVHPDDLEAAQAALERHLRGETPVYESEHRLRTKSGKWIWVNDRGRVVEHAADGTPTRIIGTQRDITKRKQGEAALSESEERYRLVFESSLDAVLLTAPDGRIFAANPAACQMFGREEREIRELGRSGIIDETDPRLPVAIETRARTGSFSGELTGMRRDGTKFPIELSTSVFEDRAGNQRTAMIIRDTTERKRAEEALRLAGAYNRSLIEASLDPLVTISSEGEITDVNLATELATGLRRDKLVGTDFSGYFTEPEKARQGYMQVLTQGSVTDYPLTIRHTDGHTIDVLYNASVFRDEAGQVKGVFAAARDITGRKRAEEALRKSEGRFRSLIEGSPIAIAIGRDGLNLYANPTYLRMFGFDSLDEIVGRPIADHWALEARATIAKRALQRTRGAHPPSEYEAVAQRKDGSQFPAHVAVAMVELLDGPVTVGFVMDVGERKRAEEALRKSEERYRSLFEQSPIGIYRTTPDGRILLANPAIVNMCGYESLEELLACNLEDAGFQPEYPRQRFKEAVEQTGELRGLEETWVRKDGRKVVVRENARAVRGPDGKVLYYEGAVEDITARKAAEEAQRRLAAAVEQTDEAVMITDPDGTIEYVNPAFERITGYSPAEASGQTPRMLKSGNHDAAFYKDLWDTITAGETWSGHFINRRKDGSTYEEEATISPVCDSGGKVVNYVAVKRDVTHEVALQQQLNQAQKMEAIGRLAGGIAHDFNNLLQALSTHAQLLRTHAGDAAHVHAEAAELEQGVSRGAALTRQLLLFSRRETTRPERLDLNEVVQSAAKMARRLVREHVAVELDLAQRRVPLNADRGQLDQVLMNLVVNASDAMPDGGRLVIRTGRDDSFAWLEVEDNGHGIPEAIRQKIFEPFFTTKGAGKGTGLGLSVVHGIVTQHHGRLELETHEGKGSRFRVVFPRAGSGEFAPVSEAAAALPDLPLGSGERVLVVEDEQGAREGLSEILASLGYEVVAVANGEDAEKLPADPPFDLVLTDLMLPGISGPALASGLEERWPSMRVILMSGYAQDEGVRRGSVQGTMNFLQKPFDMKTLARAVRSTLDEAKHPHSVGGPQ